MEKEKNEKTPGQTGKNRCEAERAAAEPEPETERAAAEPETEAERAAAEPEPETERAAAEPEPETERAGGRIPPPEGKNSGELRGKEWHFCEEYILDYNGTQAAIRAGYPEKSAAKKACGLLKRDEVMACIRELQEERSRRLCVSADFVLAQTLALLEQCRTGNPVREWDYEKHEMREGNRNQPDVKGACKCLELLAKMVGVGQESAGGYETPVFIEDIPRPKEDGYEPGAGDEP